MEIAVIRNFSIRAALSLALAFALPLAASSQPAPAPTPAAAAASTARASGDRSYILGVGDVVEVSVLGRSDFNGRARVGSDGNIVLPYLGAVTAVDRSPGQLAEDIRAALEKGGYFAQPSVRVEVVGVSSRYVTVLGFVGAPGLFPLDRQYHLSEVMARAGGKGGSGADFVILTHENGTSARYKLADLATQGGDKDPFVVAGDKIYVPPVENEVFYLSGAVKSPGAFPAGADMTVRMAIARAGGLTENGAEGKIKVTRKGVELKGVKIDVTKVEAGDVITVGERLF
jgi:polysaccharide export outer membrane protein